MPSRINLVGQTYGDFTVVEMLYKYKRSKDGKTRTYCRCIGIDNREYIIRMDALRCGATKHITHAGQKMLPKDISGQRFGHLIALYPLEKRASNGSIYWMCQCDCGNYCEVIETNLATNSTRSCGCIHRSRWEEFISLYLSSLKVCFEEQKRFKDCKNRKKTDSLPFDFFIPSYNLLIEYDGLHHFEPVKGWGGEVKFQITQENDSIKNKYCEEHNIKLLRIPYTYTENQIMQKINYCMSPVTITA